MPIEAVNRIPSPYDKKKKVLGTGTSLCLFLIIGVTPGTTCTVVKSEYLRQIFI